MSDDYKDLKDPANPKTIEQNRYEPPQLFLTHAVTVGSTWESKSSVTTLPAGKTQEHTAKGLIARQERISVPAGQFEVIKVEMADGPTRETQWFAKGVGLIKKDWSSGSGIRLVFELVRYSLSGASPGTVGAGAAASAQKSQGTAGGVVAQACPPAGLAQPKPGQPRILTAEMYEAFAREMACKSRQQGNEVVARNIETSTKAMAAWMRRYGAGVVPCSEISGNPFPLVGRVIGLGLVSPVRLVEMRGPDVGVFAEGQGMDECNFLMERLPGDVVNVLDPRQRVLLAGKVVGKAEVRGAMGSVSVLRLTFVGMSRSLEEP